MAERTPGSQRPGTDLSAGPPRGRPKLSVEELEPRIAPTIVNSGGSLLFTDSDDQTILVSLVGSGSVQILDGIGNNILPGTAITVDGMLPVGDPYDVFAFTAQFGLGVTVTVETPGNAGGGTDLDVTVGVFSSASSLIATDNNSGPDANDAQLAFVPTYPGIYYVAVGRSADGDATADGDYLDSFTNALNPTPDPTLLFNGSAGTGAVDSPYTLTISGPGVAYPGIVAEAEDMLTVFNHQTTSGADGQEHHTFNLAQNLDTPVVAGVIDAQVDIGSITFVGSDLTTELLISVVDVDTTTGLWYFTTGGSHYLLTVAGNDIDSPSGSGGVLISGGNVPGPAIYSPNDVGRILIDGTIWDSVSPAIDVDGSVEVIDIGYLAGSVDIDGDLGLFHIDTNAGLVYGAPFDWDNVVLAPGSTINVDGIIGQLDIVGVNQGYDINQGINPLGPVSTLPQPFNEIERVERDSGDPLPWTYAPGWPFPLPSVGVTDSDFVRFNDTFATPQYLPGGNFQISGVLEGRVEVTGDGSFDFSDFVDFYAFPAMPGDVIQFDEANGWPVGLFDPTGALVATSNWGVWGATETYTVESPGLYRIAVATDFDFEAATTRFWGPYTITVTGSTATTLGAYTGGTSHFADLTTFPNAVDPGILGGIELTGPLYGGTVIANGMVSISAGEFGIVDPFDIVWPEDFLSTFAAAGTGGDIGRVSTPGTWYAGHMYVDGDIPNDFDIQVVEVGGDGGVVVTGNNNVGVQVVADGNLGTVRFGGTLFPGTVGIASWIRANSDSFGGPGVIDVLEIGGDFGALSGGDPAVGTGVGGNVRFVTVGGTIFAAGPAGVSPLTPVTITGGGGGVPTLITDDSGGTMQVSVGAATTLTYRYIPIRGGGPGPGVAITSIDVVGNSFGARVSGSVEVGEVNVSAQTYVDPITGLVTSPNFRFSPLDASGEVDIYHLAGNLGNFTNNTNDGDLVYGTIGTADSLNFTGPGGDIGITEYHTAAVIQPPVMAGIADVRDQAPVRGVLATGDLPSVRVGGAIRDLIVQGYMGTVRTNSDDLNTALADYGAGLIPDHIWNTAYALVGDGATGVFYGAGADPVNGYAIVDLDVGAGLGYTGSGENANSGVFSSAIIGTVRARTAPASFVDPAIIGSGGVMNVRGEQSASIWGGIIEAGDLDDWQKYDLVFGISGPVGTVRVSGIGSTIDGTTIRGFSVDRVIAEGDATGDSAGINDITVFGFAGGINLVQADGPGILNSRFQTDGPIGDLVVTSPAGEFFNNHVQASTTLDLIDAPTIRDSVVEVFLTLGDIRADQILDVPGQGFDAGDFVPGSGRTLTHGMSFFTGGLESVVVTNDIAAFFDVAGPFGTIESTAGNVNSFVRVTGAFGDLGELSSFGDIQGAVDVQGNVGTLSSVTGDLTGDVVVGGDVGTISLRSGVIASNIAIGGDLDRLDIAGDLGLPGGIFAVGGNLGNTRLGQRGVIANINADLLVGGNVQGLQVTGGMTGNLYVGGMVRTLTFGQTVNTVPNHIAVAGRIHYPGDVDFYGFAATAAQVVTITTDTVGDGVAGLRVPDTVIGLYDSLGNLLAVDNNGAGGTDSQIAGFVIPANGTYYVAVANSPDGDPASDPDFLFSLNPADLFNGNPLGDTGPYTLTIDGSDTAGGALEPAETAPFPANNTLATAQDITGVAPFTVVGPVSRLTIGARGVVADLNGDALFMSGVSRFSISGSFNSNMTVVGDLRSLDVATAAGGHLGAPGDLLTVNGDLGRLTVGGRGGPGDLLSDLVVTGDLQRMTVTGDVLSNITVGGDLRSGRVTGDLGVAAVTQVNVAGNLQRLSVGGRGAASDLLSDLNVTGDLRTLQVSRHVVGDVTVVNGNLNRLAVGSRGVAGNLVGDIDVQTGNLQNLSVTGDVLGDIDVVGDFRTGRITGDLGLFGATHVNVGGDLRSLAVGSRGVVSTLFSDVNVGDDLGRLTAGPIWGDIVVVNDVRQVSTTSTVVPVGAPPPDFIFNNPPPGSLTAGGTIRQVRQL